MTAITDDRQRSVLVTGAGGFLGSAVVEHLSRAGFRVRAWLGGPLDAIREPVVPVETLQADITDEVAARQALTGVDVVVHLAGLPSVAASWEQPAEFARTHVVGTANLLQACVVSGVRRVVAVSSAEVYGQPDQNPVTEDSAMKPRSPYGAVKLAAEHLVESFVVGRGLDVIVLRPFSIYGRGMSPASLLGTIFRQSLSGDRVVLNNLRPVRDYCHVDDLARAVVLAAESALTGFHVFNVGSGIGTSVSDLSSLVMRLAGRIGPLEENHSARDCRSSRSMGFHPVQNAMIPTVGERMSSRTDWKSMLLRQSASWPGASEIDELIASIDSARESLGWRMRSRASEC